jgi:hypothetical protein
MNSANMSKAEMQYLIDKYSGDNVNQLLTTGLLSYPYQSSGPRQHMFSVHYAQHIMLKNPETPRCFTGWENQFGKYLNSFYKSDKSLEIVAKIVRHSSFPEISYLLVVREIGTNNYDTIKVSHYEKLSDNYGYLRPFTPMDEKRVGNTISKKDFVYKSTSLDQFGNYRYGRNYKVAYLLIPEVKDDAIVMSKSAADATKFDLITKTELVINKNDVLLNIYGDLRNYKCFPNVGEEISDKGILLATRKIDKKNLSADFTDSALNNIYYTDNKFGAHGKVVDIDIAVNDIDELQSDPHRQQLFELYNDQLRYNQEIINVLQPIVNDKNNRTTDRLEQELFNARNYVSPQIKYSCNSGNFEFAHITIYTCETQSLTRAMKTTNRCGGKAVISEIRSDEEMPVDQYGRRADVIASANGIVGRANPQQLFEQNINFTSDMILLKMKKSKTPEEAIRIQNDYLSYMSPEWGDYNKEVDSRRTKKEREEYLEALYKEKNGLYMYNPPVNGAIGWDKIKTLGKKYNIKVSKIKMCRKYKVSKDIADLYDIKEHVDFTKDFMENYTFDSKTNIIKKKNGKKTEIIKEFKTNEYGIFDVDHNTKNKLKLPLKDYKNNTWTDDFTWSKDEVGIEQLTNFDAKDTDLVNYINSIQVLEGEFEKDDFLLNQCAEKSSFDTTKSKVYRLDDTTIVREFVSRYPVVIGDVYLMVLKQLPGAAFSARSLGSMTPLGLPNKSMKKAEIGKPYGDTANQFSEMDNTDLKNLVNPEKVSRFFAVQSTSSQMRSECAEMLLKADPRHLHDLPYSDEEICCDTIPARQLAAYLNSIGLEIGDTDETDPYEFLDGVKYKSIPELLKKAGLTETDNPFVKSPGRKTKKA